MAQKQGERANQSSLHAFFRPQTQSSPSTSGRSAEEAVDLTGSPPPKKARLDNAASSSHKFVKLKAGATSSGFFSKPNEVRSSSPSSTVVKRKRQAAESSTPTVALDSFRLQRSTRVVEASSGSAFGAYTLSTAGESSTRSTRTAEEEARHERWQRLTQGAGIMPRRRSLALDEAAAAEARRASGLDTPDDGAAGEDGDTLSGEEVASALRSKYAAKAPAKRGKKKKEEEIGPSGKTYTPMEKQFMEIKAKWPDVLLLMEVGYKYKFHGDDAKNASKELGIAAFPSRNFYVASIPTHRLHIHVKKLISLGYKVGVISQMETAALKKVGDNRNTPFTRELTHLYTAATYVEESSATSTIRDDPLLPGATAPPTNALVAIVEQAGDTEERVRIALVSVIPGTGEVVWDEFDDSQVRSELETRLTHIQPAELLLPSLGLSKPTERVLKHITGESRNTACVRVERISNVPAYNAAFDELTAFYRSKSTGPIDLTEEENAQDEDVAMDGDDQVADPIGIASGLPAEDAVLALVDFPHQVVVALAMAIRYLTPFGLQNAFRHRSSFTKFINRAHMLLSGNTLENLEVYRNQTDGGVRGSLLWLLDHTKTRMGRRLMREWIGRPLLDVAALRARSDAVEEIMTNNTYHMEKLRGLLVNMPDLVRGLTRIQYAKATPTELATILVGLVRVASEFRPEDGTAKPFKSALLNTILAILPTIAEPAKRFLNTVNVKAAKADNQADLWNDPDLYPDVQDAKDCISICESELDMHLKEICKTLRRPTLKYHAVAGIEYLVEVPIRDLKMVPPKWVKISSTKAVARFHTPEILGFIKEREQHKEALANAAKRAFVSFQGDIAECHELIVVSRQLAVIDCLVSLAHVALKSGYCKPEFVAEPILKIREGRHPMVEELRDEAYVPFDIEFSQDQGNAKVITGPNMAGKSSCVRATALVVCMAQIGSFVPAESVTLGVHDAVQTRMGASDELGRGKSTFMVELSETSDILRTLTPRTLVILDELGRGTSTYDGVAIAYATLSHLAGQGCNTLFVTHYPMVAEQLAQEFPRAVSNWHMAFDEQPGPDGSPEITFLYRLKRGLADASFGVWCARLAGLPGALLARAQERSDDLKREASERAQAAIANCTRCLLEGLATPDAVDKAHRLEGALTLVGST